MINSYTCKEFGDTYSYFATLYVNKLHVKSPYVVYWEIYPLAADLARAVLLQNRVAEAQLRMRLEKLVKSININDARLP